MEKQRQGLGSRTNVGVGYLPFGRRMQETPVGARWSRWADKVRSSIDDKGKLYREQLDMVEHCILDSRSQSCLC